MTLYEMSFTYEQSAEQLRQRIRKLEQEERCTTDSHELRCIHQRLSALTPLLREAREMSTLCRHYYERSYHKNEKYTL